MLSFLPYKTKKVTAKRERSYNLISRLLSLHDSNFPKLSKCRWNFATNSRTIDVAVHNKTEVKYFQMKDIEVIFHD